jgi:general secretion pathway protein L
MSTLVVQIRPRSRLRARSGDDTPAAGARAGAEYAFALSPDGLSVQAPGRAAASLLPKATTTVAVLAEADVSWHRITLPKAPPGRLRAALEGVLEDSLLAEVDTVHFALAPIAAPGQLTWVAVVDRAWLRAELAALEKAEVFVDRVVPMTWPDDPPSGHFSETTVEDGGSTAPGVALHWSHADGVVSVRLQGGLARALLPNPPPAAARWSASPGAAAAAEHWLGAPVSVMPPAQRMLQAARSLWNLRQFDLAQRTRGSRALRDSARQFFSPAWRPVRWGLAGLVALQLFGLNLWAWQQERTVVEKRAAIQKLVKETFPRVNDIELQRDAAAVVAREAQALRAAAGRAGEGDLEPLLQAAAAAWPTDRPPMDSLRFEPGQLTLSANGWSEAQVSQFRNQLLAAGMQVEAGEGRLTVRRRRDGGAS